MLKMIMPARQPPLVDNEIYHIFNRGINGNDIYHQQRDYQKFLQIIFYYQNNQTPIKLSRIPALPPDIKKDFIKKTRAKNDFLVEIIAYCLMPNHFHFILKQKKDQGISNFIRLVSNSYSRYFNIKKDRYGRFFQGRFKAVHVKTDSQLVHLSRYIHLNPFSAHLVKNTNDLLGYPYSSLTEYLSGKPIFCQPKPVLSLFENAKEYQKFVFNQADYQRSLEKLKYLAID